MNRAIPLAFLFAALAFGDIASAQTPQPENELQDIERRLKERRDDEARLRDEAKAREKEVAALRRRMIEAADALQGAEKRLAEIDSKMAALQTEELSVKQSLIRQQNSLSDVLGALQSIERSRPPALLVAPEDAAKAARTAMLLADVTPQIEARAAGLRASLSRLAELQEALAAERARSEQSNKEVGDRRTMLAELLARKQGEKRVADRLAAAAQSETAALAARATSLRDVIGRLERLARAVAPRLKPPPPAARPSTASIPERILPRPTPFTPSRAFASARGALKPPVIGNVTGRFGTAKPDGGRIDGIRYAAADKAIVTAPFEGQVAFARAWNPIGNLIVLDVGGGYHILLMGVGAFLVEEGQSVKAGEPIGAMSGPDAVLDLEIRRNGEPVNPSLWLSDNARTDPAT